MSFIVAMENVCYLFAKLLCSQCTKGQTNRKAEIRRSTMAQGLLNGTVVLDLTRVLAGCRHGSNGHQGGNDRKGG